MVLVTGATGLIGGYLLLELSKRENKIKAMKRVNSSLDSIQKLFEEFSTLQKFNEIEWVETDLLDVPSLSDSLHGIQTIYHTAGCVGFDDREKEMIHQINVEGTENLINIAVSQNIEKFIYVSSISVLDKMPTENKIDETSKWDGEKDHSEYAISKKKGEMAVWRGSQEGLKVLVVYPSVVIGSLDGKRASEKIFELAAKKKMFATEGITGYIDVRDVAFCMAELVKQEKWNQSFIITSENKSFVEIMDFLRNKWDLTKISVLSESKLKFIRFISNFSRFFGGKYMSKSNYNALTGEAAYSNQKIKNELGVEFIPIKESLDFHSNRYKKLTH
ncbi:NAD-dependent epimerase/dehydratase family protein [Moheibacter sediminis]|uniref:Nucleoside-diphosphate-sugar epimerase n=1 Tax=Moheibacter sediminis TaxID=1434700 RepID=A0A1W2CU07_9FLAO|nr:NAD-dependent epimerase/dehydratase family protein [Moheibacter sediminis]SMC88703.1 Nucleoside-diphosphate-sugar epimerase [Moheibacter sediminis]